MSKIIDRRQCRHILDFKGVDWKTADDETRVEFALARGIIEAGLDCFELRAMIKALDMLGDRPVNIVETGLGWGYSARIFITHIIKHGGTFHTIDLHFRDEIVEPLKELGLWKYVIPHQFDSRKFSWTGEGIDFLNLDSEHALSYVLHEYFCFRMHLNRGAIVGFHDTDSCWQVAEAIDLLKSMDDIKMLISQNTRCSAGWQAYKLGVKDNPGRKRVVNEL